MYGRKGASPLVGAVLVTIAIVAGVALLGRVVRNQIENLRLAAALEHGKDVMMEIKKAVDGMAVEGGSRVIDVEFERGHLTFSSGDNLIYFSVPSGFEILPSGYRKEENGLVVSAGSNVEVRLSDDIEVENEAIIARFSKVGSASSPQPLSVSGILKSVTLKKTGKTIYPRLKVRIGDTDQSTGMGYVYAVSSGYGKNEGRVVAKVMASRYNYTIIFSIPSGADYILVKIRDIRE